MIRFLPLLVVALAACGTTVDSYPVPRPVTPSGAPGVGSTLPPRSMAEPHVTVPDDLAGLLVVALDRNPKIRAARERLTAMEEAAREAGWIPDPSIVVGWYAETVETRVGPQEWSLGLRQRIPFPTKLSTRSDLGRAEARRAHIVYERTVRDVLTEVVQTAWEVAYLDEATQISKEVAALLERYVATAAGDDGPLSDLFRAETQRTQLDHDRVLLSELRAVEETRLRALLSLPSKTDIETPLLPAIPEVDIRWEDLLTRLAARNHEIAEAGLSLEAASLRESLAEQDRLPDLTLGATRIFTGEIEDSSMTPDDNGKDPLILTLGVEIPLWVPRDTAAIRKARALRRAAAEERVSAVQQGRVRLASAWYRLGKAERLSRLYDEVLVPRARLASRTAEDLVAAGKGTLAGTLETVAVLHNFRLASARARADHAQALAALEAVLGQPFEREGEVSP